MDSGCRFSAPIDQARRWIASTYRPGDFQHLSTTGGSIHEHATSENGGGMAYRELSRMQIQEVIRRWQSGESQRSIARAMGIARVTVRRYIAHAEMFGLVQTGPPPSDVQLVELVRLASESLAHVRAQPSGVVVEPYTERIGNWLNAGLQLSRVHELLTEQIVVSYSSLRRFVVRKRLVPRSVRTTVRVAPSAPCEIAEMDGWQGGTFVDLADVRSQAETWSRDVAGQRRHGTTQQSPTHVFEQHERQHLLAYDGTPFDVPIWRTVSVHVDHHVSFQSSLYSAPWDRCPPGTRLEVRGDRQLVRLYSQGALVAVHARKPKGGRSTDPDHYPPERTAYALRSPQRIIQQARFVGVSVGAFAEQLLAEPHPWARLRQAQKLLRLCERYGANRSDQACAYALSFELLNVRRLEKHILELALDLPFATGAASAAEPTSIIDQRPPSGRFARPGTAFDHRFLAAMGLGS
jgi:hypothetical protein